MNWIRQIVISFHGLVGLSIGFAYGNGQGVLVWSSLAAIGCAFGLLAGCLMCWMPGKVRKAADAIRHNRPMAVFFSLSAHLLWLLVAISFWWVCIDIFAACTTP
jgi:hypothetical protein